MSRGRMTRRHHHRPTALPRADRAQAEPPAEPVVEAVAEIEEPVSAWREDPVRAFFDAVYRLVGEHVVNPLGDLARRFYRIIK